MLWMKFSRKDSKRAQDNGSLRMKSICIFSSIPVCIIITCQKIIGNDVYNTCSLWYLICRDAAALAEFWVWLEEEIDKDVKLTEVDAADKLLEFRSKQAGFIDTSFDTISGILTFFLTRNTLKRIIIIICFIIRMIWSCRFWSKWCYHTLQTWTREL